MAVKRRIKWLLIPAALCLIIGLDIAPNPEQSRWTDYSLVDAVSAATKPGMSVVGLIGSDYDRLESPVSRDAELTEAQVEEMVRYAVAMAGGLNQRIEPDAEWILIKPNIVELKERGSGVITDWRVVKALVKIVHEIVPQARITIGEGPAWVSPDKAGELRTHFEDDDLGDGFAIAGFRQLLDDPELADVDLDILDLNFDAAIEVEVPDGGYVFKTYHMPEAVLECDFLISVPILKVIGGVGMTNAMKNFVGTAPGLIYGFPKMRGYPGSGVPGLPHNPGILDEVIVDLVAVAEPDFAVVDAIIGMEKAKTDEDDGIPVRLNSIIAGPDLVAVDAASAMLIGFNPADIEYLSLAAYKGLGQSDPNNIKIKGQPLEQLAVRFEKYPAGNRFYGEHGHYGQGCRTWLLRGPFDRSQEVAAAEFIDVRNPGALPGQDDWSQTVYFHDDKIDLDKYFDDPFDCAVYAYAEFDAPQAQEAELWLGSDEGLRVWLNGEQVYDHAGRRRHRLPNDRPLIQLSAGKNSLLVRADQSRGRFDFSLNICAVETDLRYDGNRVWGLKFTVPASPTPVAGDMEELFFTNEESGEIPADAVLLKSVDMERQRDSLIGALEGCLRFLGAELTAETLSGITGRAFRFCVADSLDLERADQAGLSHTAAMYANIGYRTRVISALENAPDFAAKQQETWEAIRASIDRKMPVVVHGGWSYRLVNGYHPRKERYYIVRSRGRQSQMEIDELGTDDRSGGLNVLILEEQQPVDRRTAELRSLRFAVEEARRPDEPGSHLHHGLSGFDHWIAAIEKGEIADEDDPGDIVALLLETRTAAGQYLREIAVHYPGDIAARLQKTADLYDREVESLEKAEALFPRRGDPKVDLKDPGARKAATRPIREACSWEKKAIEMLEETLAQIPSSPETSAVH